jgi:hypothetical protein
VIERWFFSGLVVLAVACCSFALMSLDAAAQWRKFEADFDDGSKTWKEIETQLPPYPKHDNLLPFDVGGLSGHRFFVDAPSISVGEDGVVRYTLVIKTRGGAVNVSFEGIRCESREQKYYAIGHPGGQWSRARDPQWQRIVVREHNAHHGQLYFNYLCEGIAPRRNARAIVYQLKNRAGPM